MIRIGKFTEAINTFIAYHNTTYSSYENIMNKGFIVGFETRRKKLFGKGIYFTDNSNSRWGEYVIKVKLTPVNPLIDTEGDIQYEDTYLGQQIEEIGNKLFDNFRMTNIKQRPVAIEYFLEQNNIDMLLTQEFDKIIYVVRDNNIIHILEGYK